MTAVGFRSKTPSGAWATARVIRQCALFTQLLLDMRAVEFFGAHGFSALHFVSVCCNRFDVDWVIVGSRCVVRLLGILDPDHELPLANDFDSASQHLAHLVCRRHPTPGADVAGPNSIDVASDGISRHTESGGGAAVICRPGSA